MARIRTIKPTFFTSLTIADLTIEQRLTFIGLWTHVDDEGRCIYDPRLLKAAIWPLDDRTADDVAGDVGALTESSLITHYVLDGRAYLTVNGWREHQVINRPAASKLPAPPDGEILPLTCGDEDSRKTHGVDTDDSRPERKGRERTKNMSKAAGAASDDPLFDEFWTSYPRKEAKAAARKAWRSITRTVNPQTIIAGVRAFEFSDDRAYVPMPASWLNGRRWEDEQTLPLAAAVVKSNGSRFFTGPELDEILGVDMWRMPEIPRKLNGDVTGMSAWVERQKREHRAERVRQAIAKLQGVSA